MDDVAYAVLRSDDVIGVGGALPVPVDVHRAGRSAPALIAWYRAGAELLIRHVGNVLKQRYHGRQTLNAILRSCHAWRRAIAVRFRLSRPTGR